MLFLEHNHVLARLRVSLSGIAKMGAKKLDLALRTRRTHLLSNEHSDRLTSLLSNNAPVQALFGVLSGSIDLPEQNLDILLHLSKYRFPSDNRTLWELAETQPTLTEIESLLTLTRKTGLVNTEKAFVLSALLSMIQELSQQLLNTHSGRRLLAAPAYRRVLWETLDGILWYEFTRYLFSSLTGNSITSVGHSPSPSKYIWLVSEYGYVCLGIERDIQVHEHFRRAAQHEALLYHSRMGYRDHLFHAVNTFLIGVGFLTAKASPFASLFSHNSKNTAKPNVLRNWFLAALFHDFGYVMDILPAVQRITNNFKMGYADRVTASLGKVWEDQIGEVNCTIEQECHLHAPIGKRSNHGIFSYLHLRETLGRLECLSVPRRKGKAVAAQPGRKLRETYADALSAILKHSLLSEPISAHAEPLTTILVLCDEIQEWLRPSYGSWTLTEAMISLINFQHMLSMLPRTVSEPPVFDGVYSNNNQLVFRRSKGDAPVTVRLRYADQNVNVFEPLSRLLMKIYNLERIEGLQKVHLRFELQIPWLTGPRLRYPMDLSELSILRDFCLLCESGISSELYSSDHHNAAVKGRCSSYSTSLKGKKYDIITLDLSRFHENPRKNPLVGRPPWEFLGNLWEFKREYCRKKGALCSFFDECDDWPFRQISSQSVPS
jgi:hypothetical protein